MVRPLRIGILGAAPIAVAALIQPARRLPDIEISAIAARDASRAGHYARKHVIPTVHQRYEDVINDPTLDAIYVPLPNSLHAPWAQRALEAGKHVLCEKPLASNAQEAAMLAKAASERSLILMEAFHYRYHPLAARLRAILSSGELGQITHLEAEFSVPLPNIRSIQYRADLAGGATMDVGCYAVNMLRLLAGAEPTVVQAKARTLGPQIDRVMQADLRFADGRTARMTCALLSARLLRATTNVVGTQGELRVVMPYLPHYFHRITVRNRQAIRTEQIRGATTYTYQLRAFADAVRTNTAPQTSAHDAIANMLVIDAIYRAAGLAPRGQF